MQAQVALYNHCCRTRAILRKSAKRAEHCTAATPCAGGSMVTPYKLACCQKEMEPSAADTCCCTTRTGVKREAWQPRCSVIHCYQRASSYDGRGSWASLRADAGLPQVRKSAHCRCCHWTTCDPYDTRHAVAHAVGELVLWSALSRLLLSICHGVYRVCSIACPHRTIDRRQATRRWQASNSRWPIAEPLVHPRLHNG